MGFIGHFSYRVLLGKGHLDYFVRGGIYFLPIKEKKKKKRIISEVDLFSYFPIKLKILKNINQNIQFIFVIN